MEYIPQYEPWLGQEELSKLAECIKDNWITGGKKVKEFEDRIAKLAGVKRAIACSNGTMALFMGLKSLGIGPGDEVIVPDFTFIASANAVILAGGKPVFVDIERDTLNIDVTKIKAAITPRTKAIMPVHIYGQSANMSEIMNIAREYGLKVIEDAAQAVGVTWQGKPAGGIGDINCFSFYADKCMTTAEGGMVLTNDNSMADTSLRLENQGNLKKGNYIAESIGYNFRMTDLQAAVGLAQLDKLPEIIKRKRHNDELYREYLKGAAQFTSISSQCFNVPFRHVILVDNPQDMSEYLERNGIGTRRVFYPLHMQPCYNYGGDYPAAIWAYEHGLALPSSTLLTEEKISYIGNAIKKYRE
jgi:perosamine synthetase